MKFCPKCGTKLNENGSCEICSQKQEQVLSQHSEISDAAIAQGGSHFNLLKLVPIVTIAIMIMLAFVPVFDTWAGIIPGTEGYNLIKSIDAIASDGNYAFQYFPVDIEIAYYIPAIIMLLVSLKKRKIGAIVTSLIGMACMLFILSEYIIQNGAEGVFDFESCSISIGYWIGLLNFVSVFLIGVFSKKKNR